MWIIILGKVLIAAESCWNAHILFCLSISLRDCKNIHCISFHGSFPHLHVVLPPKEKPYLFLWPKQAVFNVLSPRLHRDIKILSVAQNSNQRNSVIQPCNAGYSIMFLVCEQMHILKKNLPGSVLFYCISWSLLLKRLDVHRWGYLRESNFPSTLSPWVQHWPSFPTVINTVSASSADSSPSELLGWIDTDEASAVWWIPSIQNLWRSTGR